MKWKKEEEPVFLTRRRNSLARLLRCADLLHDEIKGNNIPSTNDVLIIQLSSCRSLN